MRDTIIKCSILGLQRRGLRFSIDEIAKSLKISKKTIYKYFATKEDLAIEIYKTFYEEAINRIRALEPELPKKQAVTQMLTVYLRSHCMVRNEIFNKYSLNANIRALAKSNHDEIKARIEACLPQTDRAALMIMIDGSMQALCEHKAEEEKVIEKLVTLICR